MEGMALQGIKQEENQHNCLLSSFPNPLLLSSTAAHYLATTGTGEYLARDTAYASYKKRYTEENCMTNLVHREHQFLQCIAQCWSFL